jgi:hypothetical protein
MLRDPALNNGTFTARVEGDSNTNYVIESSSNLVDWATLQTLAMTNRLTPFTDTSVTNAARRFYRIRAN